MARIVFLCFLVYARRVWLRRNERIYLSAISTSQSLVETIAGKIVHTVYTGPGKPRQKVLKV